MLDLQNINKIYLTRGKNKIYALKDINITFPNKGMCLILGDSGCGKTTLLNIIGGLDKKFTGQYLFQNEQLIKTSDFDRFRKNYVSFIFQDFNLIDDLNIEENLSIGYRFSSSKATSEISIALDKVGLSGYEKRYPSELSGGEQQRVAVARALLKDSKILLADEPTGNLDTNNSIEIYKLLKEIAQEKLIIIVSHNEKLGYEYADYVVKLEKGVIIENNIPQSDEQDVLIDSSNEKVISNKTAIKMACHEFSHKKGKTFLTVLLMLVAFSILSVTISIFQYHHVNPHYNLIKDQKYEYFKVDNLNYEIYQSILDENIDLVFGDGRQLNFESKEEAEKAGIKFYETDKEIPLTPSTYYISDAYLKRLFYGNFEATINNEIVKLNFEEYQLTDVIGEKIGLFGYDNVCAGIYYSPFGMTNSSLEENDEYDEIHHYLNSFYGEYIQHTSLFNVQSDHKNIKVNASVNNNTCELEAGFGLCEIEGRLVLDGEGNVKIWDDSTQLADNEAYISLATYNKIFGTYYTNNYLIDVDVKYTDADKETTYSSKFIPQNIGSDLDISAYYKQSKSTHKFNNLIIKGIVFTRSEFEYNRADDSEYICMNDKNVYELKLLTKKYGAWIKTDTVKDLQKFMHSYYDKYGSLEIGFNFVTPISKYLLDFENSLSHLQLVMFLASIALVIMAIIMISVLISGQILDRKREIGIFKALGARNKDILKIYLYELLIMTIPIVIMSIIPSIFIVKYVNSEFVADTNPAFTYIYYSMTNIPYIIVAIFLLIFLAVILPLLRIVRLNVIEAIRNN